MCRKLASQAVMTVVSILVLAASLLLAAILIPRLEDIALSPRATAQSGGAVRAANGSNRPQTPSQWRRTTRGWERRSEWELARTRRVTPPLAAVHPLLPAALILLLSTAALVAFSPARRTGKLALSASRC
jgi:hypothetical protein